MGSRKQRVTASRSKPREDPLGPVGWRAAGGGAGDLRTDTQPAGAGDEGSQCSSGSCRRKGLRCRPVSGGPPFSNRSPSLSSQNTEPRAPRSHSLYLPGPKSQPPPDSVPGQPAPQQATPDRDWPQGLQLHHRDQEPALSRPALAEPLSRTAERLAALRCVSLRSQNY